MTDAGWTARLPAASLAHLLPFPSVVREHLPCRLEESRCPRDRHPLRRLRPRRPPFRRLPPQEHHSPAANPVRALQRFGQSVWLDYLRRSLFTSGEFKRLIAEDGLRGATSNPSIFEKAIAGSTDYLDALHQIEGAHDAEPMVLYEALAIRDIRDAADLLRPVYDATSRVDGYVSLEVSPYLAHDTEATIAEARRLWKAVGRENVMIKVPASTEGLPAIRQLTSEGINVNITLLFGIERYEEVARAYVEGLSLWVQNGGDPARVCSVASFFVSRIDTMVDGLITARLATETDAAARTSLTSLLGTVAIANAKLAYQRYLACVARPSGRRWPREAPTHNVCCGRAPAPRTLATVMCATSRS